MKEIIFSIIEYNYIFVIFVHRTWNHVKLEEEILE